MYRQAISAATGVTDTGKLEEIEDTMRGEVGTLDNLTAAKFNALAKRSYKILQQFGPLYPRA